MSFNDEQLLLLYAKGRAEAFEELFARHHAAVHGFVSRMLRRRPADAEDLVQETFFRVARAAPRYRPEGRFTGFLYRVATNCCLQFLAAEGRRRHLRVVGATEPAAHDASPHEAVAGRADAVRLEAAVAELPPAQRAAFLLRQVQGLAYDDIALALGQPLGTIKTNLHRARLRLAEALADLLPAAACQKG